MKLSQATIAAIIFGFWLFGLNSIAFSQTNNQLTEAQIADGWIALFDGESTFGWQKATKANWRALDGALQVNEGEGGLLRTTSQFDNYILRFEFQCPNDTNSGVFLRTSPRPKNVKGDCYEYNIAPADNPFPTGSLVKRQKLETFWQDEHDPETWHQCEITIDGDTIQASIDGGNELTYTDERPLGRGYIGLQHNKGQIAFRNIYLKPLGLTELIDADLSQWKQDQNKASTFTCEEGVLHVEGGSGQIESKETFADFMFSMKCRTNAPGLNSGVFYRCIPGDFMNGYESQIQNQMVDEDPAQPKDCGTGGIFRRQNARKIVAEDEEWFTKTIVATGPHVSVWVNGFQVTDWSDTRKPNENPRRGLRLEAGTIILQGHDPTTDIDFKEIKARELTVRRPEN